MQPLHENSPENFDHVSGAAAQNNGPCPPLSSGEISPKNFAQNYSESQNKPAFGAAAQTHASIIDTSEYFVHTGDCNTYHDIFLQSMPENPPWALPPCSEVPSRRNRAGAVSRQDSPENFAATSHAAQGSSNSTARWSAEPTASDASQRTAPRRNPTRPWRRQRWSAAKAMP